MCGVAIKYKSALGFRGQNSLSLSVKFPCLFFTDWFFCLSNHNPQFLLIRTLWVYASHWDYLRSTHIYFTSWWLLWTFCPNLYPCVRAEILWITVVIICRVRPSLINATIGIDALMVSFCGECIYMHVWHDMTCEEVLRIRKLVM